MNPTEWMYDLMQTSGGRVVALLIAIAALALYIYCIYLEAKYE